MKIKYILLLILAFMLNLILMACAEIESLPQVMEVEDAIKEIIVSKGEDYDFMKDELYIENMKELISFFIDNNVIKEEHFTLGNLDHDNIPELVIYRERNPENTDDEGILEIYKFNGEKYSLLDSVSMNFDNTNYQLVIGKIAEGQNGLYLNNYVGAHSSITYGYILRDDKLVSILNGKKLNLMSPYASSEIKDIDNDGILEFSVPIVDPEVEDPFSPDTSQIILWYKWDGNDGGLLTKVDRIDGASSNNTRVSDEDILNQAKEFLENADYINYMTYHLDNKAELSLEDNSKLLKRYFSILNEDVNNKSMEVNDLFLKYQLGDNFNYLSEKYSLSLDKLNNLNYLKKEDILSSEKELKSHLISNLSLGYSLTAREGMYEYSVNYQQFLDEFGNHILKEYKDYFKIRALESSQAYLVDGSLVISQEELAERIVLLENYMITYPYSNFFSRVNKTYKEHMRVFIFGSLHISNFSQENHEIDKDILESFIHLQEQYPHTNFADLLSQLLAQLDHNDNKLDEDTFNKFNKLLN